MNVILALLGAVPLSGTVGAILGYLFGPSAVQYIKAAISYLYADIKGKLTGLFSKKPAA